MRMNAMRTFLLFFIGFPSFYKIFTGGIYSSGSLLPPVDYPECYHSVENGMESGISHLNSNFFRYSRTIFFDHKYLNIEFINIVSKIIVKNSTFFVDIKYIFMHFDIIVILLRVLVKSLGCT